MVELFANSGDPDKMSWFCSIWSWSALFANYLLTLRLLRKKWIKPVRVGTSTREVITPLILSRITWNFHIQFADRRWPFYRRKDGHVTRKSHDRQVYQEPFKTLKKKKKKKNVTRDQCPLCTIANETSDIQRFYCYSYFFLTGNDSGVMGFFFQKIVICWS